MRLVVLFMCLWIITASANAQDAASPLVAAAPSSHDRIILYDVNGGGRELSFGAGWHIPWGFSPDGCRLLFTLSDTPESPARLYSAQLDGSDLRSLVAYPDLPDTNWGVWEPQWSPDGSRIAFTMMRLTPGADKPQHHIAWITPEGGEPEFYSRTGEEFEPAWSPDGAWLAYTSYTERVAGAEIYATAEPTLTPLEGQAAPVSTLLYEADIWLVSADGNTKYPMTDFPTGSARAPRWSPDGFLVGFTFAPSPNNDQFWMTAYQQGAIPTQLSYQWSLILDITWLPDSSAMLSAVRDFHEVKTNLLWRIPLVGNADNDATPYLSDPLLDYADYPRFSADGRWLAFRSNYTLMLLDTASNQWRVLDSTRLGNTPPVWTPAGFGGEASC